MANFSDSEVPSVRPGLGCLPWRKAGSETVGRKCRENLKTLDEGEREQYTGLIEEESKGFQ